MLTDGRRFQFFAVKGPDVFTSEKLYTQSQAEMERVIGMFDTVPLTNRAQEF